MDDLAAQEQKMKDDFAAEQAADAAYAQQQYEYYNAWVISQLDAQ